MNLFAKKYPGANNVILEHPVYDIEYPNIPGKEESLEKLGLSPWRTYLLCFGAFRSKEERKLIMDTAKNLEDKSIMILAPTFFKIKKRRNILKMFTDIALFFYYKVICKNIHFEGKNIPHSLLPYYFSVCDIGIIQRTRILNSGNLPLNFYFGNIVVGPNTGNVGAILKESGNPVFGEGTPNTLAQAVSEAVTLLKSDLREKNRHLAVSRWNSAAIAGKQLAQYDNILANRKQNSPPHAGFQQE